jgi:hypothetical protein
MFLIAHRGNTNGPNKERENAPDYIDEALAMGYDVEVDVWVVDGAILLGHDKPENKINKLFLNERKNKLWCHAKNLGALVFLLRENFNTFSHDNDPYVITSKGYIWASPHSEFTSETIAVMPEWNNYAIEDISHCTGVCSDFVGTLKNTKV